MATFAELISGRSRQRLLERMAEPVETKQLAKVKRLTCERGK